VLTVPLGIMKPDITFFGEKLTDDFDDKLLADRESVDLLLVIGTSLKVSPVAEILTHLPHSIPQIVINKTPLQHINPDIVLLGDADGIVQYLSEKLGWDIRGDDPHRPRQPRKRSSDVLSEPREAERVGDSHVWLFKGADGGSYVDDLRAKQALAAQQAERLSARSRQKRDDSRESKRSRHDV